MKFYSIHKYYTYKKSYWELQKILCVRDDTTNINPTPQKLREMSVSRLTIYIYGDGLTEVNSIYK